jgi:hypothetical protein
VAVARQVADHAGDLIVVGALRRPLRHRPAEHVRRPELLQRLAFRQDERVDVGERGRGRAPDELELEDVEEGGIDVEFVDIDRLPVAKRLHPPRQGDGDRLDLREAGGDRVADRVRAALAAGDRLARLVPRRLHLEDPLAVRQPFVVAGLVAHVEEDEQAGREAEREAEDVDERVGSVLREGAEADRQIIAPHRLLSYS